MSHTLGAVATYMQQVVISMMIIKCDKFPCTLQGFRMRDWTVKDILLSIFDLALVISGFTAFH